MSAGEEKDASGGTPAKPRASKKPAATKKPAAKDEAAGAGKQPPGGKKAVAPKKPAGKKPAAERKPPAAKEPVAAKELVAAEEPKVPATKPARRPTRGAKPAPRRRVVRAHARYVHTSARKARMVCGHLRGKSVQEARAILAFTPREVARDWSKLLESAVANAESNHELLEDDLIVREAYADEGPTIKRFQPRAMGRATPIRKRTSHLTITLTPGA
jgi:ribosomal protein L22